MTEFEKWLLGNSPVLTRLDLLQQWRARQRAISEFSFAILNEKTVKTLLPYGPFLEVGAGTGYWAWELSQAGADIIAVDPHPYKGIAYKASRTWGIVLPMTAEEAIWRYISFLEPRTLLMVWPSYNEDWPAQTLEKFQEAGGQRLIYVGEGSGGCTANDRFHSLLEESWESVDSLSIPQWQGLHDYIEVFRRKT